MGNIYLQYMLLRQLDYLDKFQVELLDLYSSKPEEQGWFSVKLDQYKTYIQEVLSSPDVSLSYHPKKVIINSEVTLTMVDGGAVETYTICLPEQDGRDRNYISITKPLGATLLLAPLQSKITMNERGRKRKGYVEKIEVLPMVSDSKNSQAELRIR